MRSFKLLSVLFSFLAFIATVPAFPGVPPRNASRLLLQQDASAANMTFTNMIGSGFLTNAGPDRPLPPSFDRPPGVSELAFHGSRFDWFDEFGRFGFVDDGTNPAVVHMPVFLHGRIGTSQTACYPESPILLGKFPIEINPGTNVTWGQDPGEDCTDPGDYHGAYTEGIPFPIYVSAALCGDEWWVNFDVYYVHDGNLGPVNGHVHDWEGITVVFTRDPGGNGADWWVPGAAIYSWHDEHHRYDWKDLITVDVNNPSTSDIRDEKYGNMRKHPKVYVGLYSHAAYRRKVDYLLFTNYGKASGQYEYRSDDWWRLPQRPDVHLWDEIKGLDWDGKSSPEKNHYWMCHWDIKKGPTHGDW